MCDDLAHGGRGHPPRPLKATALAYVEAADWTFAKTMPNNPHEYAVRQRAHAAGLGAGHEALFKIIWDYPLVRRWHGRPFRSIDTGGWSIWLMDAGTVINRKPIGRAGWDTDEYPAERVACPYCGARPNVPCRTRGGFPANPHADRVRIFRLELRT